MPKGSEALTSARREEIVDACAKLYEQKPFREITLGEIGEKTSFTRTSIYNYFCTKEEIFLALLEREYRWWNTDLAELASAAVLRTEDFSERFAAILEKRRCMLKLMSMNLYDMESASRLENLTAFKRTYRESTRAVERCLERHVPQLTAKDKEDFIYAFFPFLFGIYPYTAATAKQAEAMALAGVEYRRLSIHEIVKVFVETLLIGLVGK